MALLTYEEVRNSASPTKTLLEFMKSAYQAGAKSAGEKVSAAAKEYGVEILGPPPVSPSLVDEMRTGSYSRPPTTSTTKEFFMTDGVMLAPGGGRRITGGGMDTTLKVPMSHPSFASTFEIIVLPGFDVGAHVHTGGEEEMFYVVEGQLDVLAFEPVDQSVQDWHEWESESGEHFLRGGPGSFMYVPIDTPHAFANRSDRSVKMFFQSTIEGGHENYFDELAFLLEKSGGQPSQSDVEALRWRYDIEQLTAMHGGAHM